MKSKRMTALLPLLAAVTLLGCNSETAAVTRLEGTLTLEVRDQASVVIEPDGALPSLRVEVTPSAGYDLLPAGQTLVAQGGRLERFPEASARLYTAKMQAPAQPGGPCGDEPISLALSLHRQADNATVIGGLTAYCGEGRWHGVPVRILRLAGSLPLPSAEAP